MVMPSIGAWQAVFACCLLLTSLGWQQAQAQSNPDRLVTIEPGDLPIILSAPHGGHNEIPGVPARRGEGVAQFKNRSDSRTDELADKLADALESKLGKRPYIVIARFHRKYLDANRRASGAYESENAKEVYDTYHHALASARREVTRRWGHGMLLDIHGQSAKPKTIIRGTQNGKTTRHLVNRFGHVALRGETSLFGQLANQGFAVIPAVDSTDQEHPAYDGGYIVRTYGSEFGGTVDAIQLELGIELRSPEVIAATANKLADAIAAFASEYLPHQERSAPGEDRTP